MEKLPIIVEAATGPFEFFGALVVAFALWMIVISVKGARLHPNATRNLLAGLAGFGIPLVLGAYLILMNVNWQFRLDERGIVLRAPFDFLRPGGTVAWSDIASMHIRRPTSKLGHSHQLIIMGKGGSEIVLAAIGDLPAKFAPMFQKFIEERAPQARLVPNSSEVFGEFAIAREERWWALFSTYRVRNGVGEEMK